DAERLGELWSADIVFMLCDGAYPEIGGGVTLAALFDWCEAGGVLVEVAASAFLLAATGAGLVPAIRGFIDIFGLVIDSNGTDQAILLRKQADELLDAEEIPSTLLQLNHGSDRRTTLNAAAAPDIAYVTTGSGACVLGEYNIGRGCVIRWAAAACGPAARAVQHAQF